MAYQNVGTPRFYINIPEWLASSGVSPLSGFENHLRTLPVKMETREDISFTLKGMTVNGFVAILGHTMKSDASNSTEFYNIRIGSNAVTLYDIINTEDSVGNNKPPHNGFSIAKFIGYDTIDNCYFTGGITKVGSIVIGTYYDIPHSPELNLTMTREMDGVNRIRTKGGNDLINYKYTKSPLWGDTLAPWELGISSATYKNTVYQRYSRVGRRTWDLSFSHLDGNDVFGSNQSLGVPMNSENPPTAYAPIYTGGNMTGGSYPFEGYEEGDLYLQNEGQSNEYSAGFNYNLLTDNNFFSQVIHKTNGGQLPFIFQPDNNNNNPDNFAICKLDMDTFKFDQVANGVYNIKLKIREVW